MNAILNEASTRLLKAAFPNGGAYLVAGRYDKTDDLAPFKEGPAGTFDLPDDADLYYCVASIAPGKDRTAVDRVMVLVIDDVGKEIDMASFMSFPLDPSFMVESSRGSYQVGFLIDGGMDPDEYRALRQAMRGNPVWGGAHNTGAAAIFRLPQGMHTKSTKGRWKVSEKMWDGALHKPEDIWKALGAGAPRALGQGSKFDLVASEGLLDDLLALIPNDVANWDLLANVGRAVWGASEGLWDAPFHTWAAKFPGHDPAITQGRWDSYHDASIGRYWLLRLAQTADPAGAEAWLRKEAIAEFDDGVVEATPAAAAGLPNAKQLKYAQEIARRWGDRIRYNLDVSAWMKFEGHTWKTLAPGVKLAYQLSVDLALRAPPRDKGDADITAAAFHNGVEDLCRQWPSLQVGTADFDIDAWMLGTPGGVVDLRTGMLRGAVAGDMVAKATAVVPAASEACPEWIRFMDWACTDPATVTKAAPKGVVDLGMLKTLKQWAGYCLTGDVSEEAVMFLHGDGKNGKGTFIETLQWVMGDYFYMADKDLFMEGKFKTHTEEIAALAGRRMVAADEVPTNAKWNESLLKSVSGGGTVTSRHLYGRMFTFPIQFKVTIIGNEKPAFQGTINEALKRRLHLAEFRMTAQPVDSGLKARLRGEGAGVLRWALNGLQDLQAGFGKRLFIADSLNAATDEYFNDSDLFGEWLREQVERQAGASAPAGKLFENWEGWRNSQGNHELLNSHKKFKAEMLKRGELWEETNKGSFYKGLVVKIF